MSLTQVIRHSLFHWRRTGHLCPSETSLSPSVCYLLHWGKKMTQLCYWSSLMEMYTCWASNKTRSKWCNFIVLRKILFSRFLPVMYKLSPALPMLPASDDNYEMSVHDVLVLSCSPPVVVISTNDSTCYHCILLPSEDHVSNCFVGVGSLLLII